MILESYQTCVCFEMENSVFCDEVLCVYVISHKSYSVTVILFKYDLFIPLLFVCWPICVPEACHRSDMDGEILYFLVAEPHSSTLIRVTPSANYGFTPSDQQLPSVGFSLEEPHADIFALLFSSHQAYSSIFHSVVKWCPKRSQTHPRRAHLQVINAHH